MCADPSIYLRCDKERSQASRLKMDDAQCCQDKHQPTISAMDENG